MERVGEKEMSSTRKSKKRIGTHIRNAPVDPPLPLDFSPPPILARIQRRPRPPLLLWPFLPLLPLDPLLSRRLWLGKVPLVVAEEVVQGGTEVGVVGGGELVDDQAARG
jgi:hypothetical protein